MTPSDFNDILSNTQSRVSSVLGTKADEYATDDRLHNFKVAAEMQKTTPRQALAGMMAKHTVSIYDMCRSGKSYDRAVWDEKIIDHINYLYLLRAIIIEDELLDGYTVSQPFTDKEDN